MIMCDIKNRKYYSQVKDFSGLKWGKLNATDIDCVIDFAGKIQILIDAKYGQSDCPFGQSLLYTNMIDGLQRGGIEAYAIIATHTSHIDSDIDFANTQVVKYYHSGEWKYTHKTTKELIDKILTNHGYSPETGRKIK